MQRLMILGSFALSVTLSSVPALAQPVPFRAEAKLMSPGVSTKNFLIAGVEWRCEGDTCKGASDRRRNLDGPVRECRKVTAAIGAIVSYRTGSFDLPRGQVRACNVRAAGGPGTEH